MVVMQIEVLCGHPVNKLNLYTFSDRFYGNLKIAIIVAILTNFGQTQVLDRYQHFHWIYCKIKTKQPREPNLVPKWPQLNFQLNETLKTSQKSVELGLIGQILIIVPFPNPGLGSSFGSYSQNHSLDQPKLGVKMTGRPN